MHEIGHIVGLGHAPTDQLQTMYRSTSAGKTLGRTFGNGDILGFKTAYGIKDTPPPPPDPEPTPEPPTPTPPPTDCTTGWKITGYFLPFETDFTGATETVIVDGKPRVLKSAFLAASRIEGWGKTSVGDFVGPYGSNNTWISSTFAKDANGGALIIGIVAVDRAIVPNRSKLTIPTLPAPWNTRTFTANDIGNGVKGKHVDVYCGEGKAAEQETFRITSQNQTVCVGGESPPPPPDPPAPPAEHKLSQAQKDKIKAAELQYENALKSGDPAGIRIAKENLDNVNIQAYIELHS
jgi:3D (Asp-Asp-Asp) domain-containing protein